MPSDKAPQFKSEDGFLYILNSAEKCWYMLRRADILPADVIDQIAELWESYVKGRAS